MKLARMGLMSALLAGTVALAGCSLIFAPPPEESASPTAGASGAASATAETAEPVDPFAPVLIDPKVPIATAIVGDALAFDIPEDAKLTTTITSDKPDVIEVFDASEDAGFVLDAGATALAAGTAVLTFTSADGTTTSVTVTVSE